ncbi:MAG TPA: thioredoxin domain-containing protein [Terriglobia bacterium]|jgi:protein-disulfide isomerase|nr:thioredoxin domain-containing protein [Terriglobia bacterium]
MFKALGILVLAFTPAALLMGAPASRPQSKAAAKPAKAPQISKEEVMRGAPSLGPADAPITIIEFSDLQCPSCARLHEILVQQVVPKYGNKVRIVFKEFPLTAVHDWSLTAAIASQCAYSLDPSAYVPFRSAIFQSQLNFNVTNVRSLLLAYGEQVGLDRLKLSACIDSKRSLPRVEKDVRDGKLLGVKSTPTFFINGQPVVGIPTVEALMATLNEMLQRAGL